MTVTAGGHRRLARETAFRVAYQSDIAGDAVADAWAMRRQDEVLNDDQRQLVEDVVGALSERGAEIDGALRAAAEHWPLERMAATDRAVLRVAVAELLGRAGVPARVVLDEAVEIGRRFGGEQSGAFVNGILDRVARTLRPAEFA